MSTLKLSTSFVTAIERRQLGAHHASKNHKSHLFLAGLVKELFPNIHSEHILFTHSFITGPQFHDLTRNYSVLSFVFSPRRKISPIFEKLSKAHDSITFVKIDIDEFPEMANEYTVRSVPTFLFLSGKTTVSEVSSLHSDL